ncbi:MAG: HAD family phosphatase [Oscillospiraceae bacterium]|nr:HAD family phosphatase [Oscillospiraceae bacterium]MBR0392496.1 HAD family phosphatase [Oscillospiraceae bacterium]
MKQQADARCVLFDFDGVIADTERSNAAYLEKALAVFGISLKDELKDALIGVNSLDVIRPLLDSAEPPVTPEQLAEVRLHQGNTYENSPNLKAQPGVHNLLLALRQRGIKTGLVTSTSSRLILAALNRLSLAGQFDVILCGDMVKKKKPDPEGYQTALKLLHTKPENCVIIEDSPVGILAGLAAGAYVIAYEGGEIQQDTSLAHTRIASFEECLDLLFFR